MVNTGVSKLRDEEFLQVIKNAPLVSVDLIVRNPRDEIFLAFRKNQPAKGYWFVPGGRILKDETIDNAFQRIVETDLRVHKDFKDADFLGVFEHFYQENRFETADFGTHYVVLAYEINVSETLELSGTNEHAAHKWSSVSDLLSDAEVHPNTKTFFL
jgi:colanic acid biosynthesis protein WcaH